MLLIPKVETIIPPEWGDHTYRVQDKQEILANNAPPSSSFWIKTLAYTTYMPFLAYMYMKQGKFHMKTPQP